MTPPLPASPEPAGTPEPTDRVLRLDGGLNVRDLGGLRTRDSRAVRRGRVLRSDFPGFAVADDGDVVRRLGLRSVVDLRRGTEAEVELADWERHGVEYARVPLVAGGEDSWHAPYRAYLTHRPETVVAAVARVMDVDAHPVLFHCAAGKDRTGVIAALVLEVLGVPREEVVADYTQTQDALAAILARLGAIPLYAEMMGEDPHVHQVPRPETMHLLLGWLDELGGAEQWLVEHGLATGVVDRFRAVMLDD